MAVEDFTTYTETDEGDDITVTATRVQWAEFLTRQQQGIVSKDFGAGYFSSSFNHDFTMTMSNHLNSARTVFWAISNNPNDAYYWAANNNEHIRFYCREDTSPPYDVHLYELYAPGSTQEVTLSASLTNSTVYYARVVFNDAVGDHGQITVNIYTDSGRTNLHATGSLTLERTPDYRYLFPLTGYDSSSGDNGLSTGYVENLDLDPVLAAAGRSSSIASKMAALGLAY